MTNERQEDDAGIWQQDWEAQADERTERYAAPDVDAPEVTLQPRALTSRLAAGGRFEKPLAGTLRNQPSAVLRTIASSVDSKPMLTVQSATSARTLAAGTRPEPAPEIEEPADEPVAEEPAYAAPPVAPAAPRSPSGGSNGGLFAGATDFVLRLLRRQPEPEPEAVGEPAGPTPTPAPMNATVQPVTPASSATGTIARTPEAHSRAPDPVAPPTRPETSAPDRSAVLSTDTAPAPLLAGTEDETEAPLQSSTPMPAALHAGTTPLVLRSHAVEAPASIERVEGEPVETPQVPERAPEAQVVDPVQETVESPIAPTSSEAPILAASLDAPIESTTEQPLIATSTIARHEAAQEEPTALEEPALARSQEEPAHGTLESYNANMDERPVASSEPSGLGNLFLTLRRLVTRESDEESPTPERVEPAATPIESAPAVSAAPIARSVEAASERPAPAAALVLASEAVEAQEEPALARTESYSVPAPALDLHADGALEDDGEAPEYESPLEAQTAAYTRFALLRARSAGEESPESPALEEPAALQAQSLEDEAPVAVDAMAATAQGEFIDAPSEALTLRSTLRTTAEPTPVTPSYAESPPTTIARTVSEPPQAETPRTPGARSSEHTAPMPVVQRSAAQPATRESAAASMPLQVARTAVMRSLERESAPPSPFDARTPDSNVSASPVLRSLEPAFSVARSVTYGPSSHPDFSFEDAAFATTDDVPSFSAAATPSVTSTAAPIARSAAPLVYRQVQRTGDAASEASGFSAVDLAQYDFGDDPIATANAVLAMAGSGSGESRTLSAPASVIQRLASGEGATEAPAASAMSAAGTATGTGATPAPAGADSGAAVDPAKAPNLVLDKLAREIYERLRRRLLMERERAGYGTAFS